MDPEITGLDRYPVLDHCGILAIAAPNDVACFKQAEFAFRVLQTRGYDGAGFWAVDTRGEQYSHKGEGLIASVFSASVHRRFDTKKAVLWLFQNRYGTSGEYHSENVQPFTARHQISGEVFTVVHNGQFSHRCNNDYQLLSDTAEFVQALSQSKGKTWPERIKETLTVFKGAYSLIIAAGNSIFCARDPLGVRPLVYGKLSKKPPYTFAVSSETACLDALGAVNLKEVLPGMLLEITQGSVRFHQVNGVSRHSGYCIFENVYVMDGKSISHAPAQLEREIRNKPTINLVRYRSGQLLAQEHGVSRRQVDFVCGIPGTGIAGGQGFANQLFLPYVQAISDKVIPAEEQRTFMTAQVSSILAKVLEHFEIYEDMFAGKRVVLVDDSLVRGNVTKGLIQLLRERCGVATVHVRILSPMIDKPCYLGISTRVHEQLLAFQCQNNIEKMRKAIHADSLAFLSVTGLKHAITNDKESKGFCTGCMEGYQPPITLFGKRQTTCLRAS